MELTQEFLVLQSNGDVAVYTVKQFPRGTPIGPDAQRLRVVGPSRVEAPGIHLTPREFDHWRQELEREGRQVTLGPFWTNPAPLLPLKKIDPAEASFVRWRKSAMSYSVTLTNEAIRKVNGWGLSTHQIREILKGLDALTDNPARQLVRVGPPYDAPLGSV